MKNKVYPLPSLIILCFVCFFHPQDASGQNAVTTLCGTSAQGNPFYGTNGLCITPDGLYIYVCDYSANRIKKVTVSSGSVTNYAGTGVSGYQDGPVATAQFSYPSGIKISSDGLYLYVCDNNNCLIRKISIAAGTVSTIAGVNGAFSYADSSVGLYAQFNQPIDLAIAPGDSVLYVSDAENHVIRKINLITTEVSTIAGTPAIPGAADGTGMSAKFHNPNGLCVSSSGAVLYVADAGNNKIRKIDLTTYAVTTIAGNGTAAYADNALGNQASFNIPQGVAVLPNDSILYVADTFNHRIRSIDLGTTAVSTVAGSNSTFSSHFADNVYGLSAKFWQPVNCVLSNNSDKLCISDQENYRIRIMNTDFFMTGIVDGTGFANDVIVYPNPCTSSVTVWFADERKSRCKYELYDIRGKKMMNGENITNNKLTLITEHLIPGVYFLRLTREMENKTIKILKQN